VPTYNAYIIFIQRPVVIVAVVADLEMKQAIKTTNYLSAGILIS